ncbi:hypothetical protein AAY473_033659 [Plecturocebus cupreus]
MVLPASEQINSANHFGKWKQAGHLRSGVQDQPGQHGDTPSLLKIQKLARDLSLCPAVSSVQENNAGNKTGTVKDRSACSDISSFCEGSGMSGTMLTNPYDCRAIMPPKLRGGCLSWGKEDPANACQLPYSRSRRGTALLQEDILPLPSLTTTMPRLWFSVIYQETQGLAEEQMKPAHFLVMGNFPESLQNESRTQDHDQHEPSTGTRESGSCHHL